MSVSNSQFAAMNGSPSSLADDAAREAAIRETFQPILAEHRTWANDPDVKAYPPGLVLRLVKVLLNVLAAGLFPQKLGAAWSRLLELAKRTVPVGMFDLEAVDSSGRPKLAWIRAMEEFDASLKPKIVPNRVCPNFAAVMKEFDGDLRRDLYVARSFGVPLKDEVTGEFRWRGPLFNESGDPDATAIFRESKNPGSVIPEGFHPADLRNPPPVIELEPVPASLLASLRRCLEINDVRKVEAVEDPATIEELLMHGQYVPVIARVKNVSEDHVRAVAARLGIAAKTQSDDYKPANILSEEDQCYARNMQSPSDSSPAFQPVLESDEPSTVSSSAPEFAAVAPADAGRDEKLNELLRSMLERDPDCGTPQAMSALKNSGLAATGAEVGRLLAAMRRELTAAK